jgi:hypothetical protein
LAFLTQNTAIFVQNIDHNIGLKKRAIFRQKQGYIAENCYHNIDPKSPCKMGHLHKANMYIYVFI